MTKDEAYWAELHIRSDKAPPVRLPDRPRAAVCRQLRRRPMVEGDDPLCD